jgi:hypothetical protein
MKLGLLGFYPPSFGRLFGGGVDVLRVHPFIAPFWWLFHRSVSSLAAKGEGATT